MASSISPHALIDAGAEIGDEVHIGPFCVIGPDVKIGHGTRLENNVTLTGRVTLGEHNHLFPGVVIGAYPQDVSYRGTRYAGRDRRSQHFSRMLSPSIEPAKKKTASPASAATTL